MSHFSPVAFDSRGRGWCGGCVCFLLFFSSFPQGICYLFASPPASHLDLRSRNKGLAHDVSLAMQKSLMARRWLPLCFAIVFTPVTALPQNLLPNPTGPLPVGRVSYHWVDSARPEPLAQNSAAERELMVDVWYPAQTSVGASPSSYLPDLPVAAKVLGEAGARKALGPAYDEVTNGRLSTHAQEDAAFASSLRRCPVLIFSHGLGVLKTGYTAQIEDLASHGYIVVSIAHTYDTWLVSFPDGHIARFDQEGRKAHAGSEAARNEYGNERLQVWAADIRFVVDQLTRYDREADFHSPLTGHLDLHHIGALGHSDGGRAAALGCQTDSRIRACLDMDGVADNLPFYRDVKGKTFEQPFLLFVRKKNSTPPTEDELKEMGYTRDAFAKLVAAVEEKQVALLRTMPGGAYRVTLKTEAGHMSFSDLPLLESADTPEARVSALLNQRLVREYTLAFFDETLRNAPGTLLGRTSRNLSTVQIEWYPPKRGEARSR